MGGGVLEDAQSEFGKDGQQVVEYIGLDALVAEPVGIVGEDVDLQGQSLGRGGSVADEEGVALMDLGVIAQVGLHVGTKGSQIGQVPPVQVVVQLESTLAAVVFDFFLFTVQVAAQQSNAAQLFQQFGVEKGYGGLIDQERPLDAPPAGIVHALPVDERAFDQLVGRNHDDGVVPIPHFDRMQRDLDHAAIGPERGRLDPIPHLQHLVGRELQAGDEGHDRVAEDQQDQGGEGTQTAEKDGRRLVQQGADHHHHSDQDHRQLGELGIGGNRPVLGYLRGVIDALSYGDAPKHHQGDDRHQGGFHQPAQQRTESGQEIQPQIEHQHRHQVYQGVQRLFLEKQIVPAEGRSMGDEAEQAG